MGVKVKFSNGYKRIIEYKIFKNFYFFLNIFLVFEGLDAYSINNIPIYWIGVSFLISVFVGIYNFWL